MAGTIAIEIRAGDGNIVVGGEGGIRGLTPLASAVESSGIALAGVVAHLTSGFDDPWLARCGSDVADVSVTAGAKLGVHRSALALGYRTGMAEVARIQIAGGAVLVERLIVRDQNLRTMQKVHVTGFRSDAR